jgi:hypothetical protein
VDPGRFNLAHACVHEPFTEHHLVVVNRDRGVGPLVRINTDHHHLRSSNFDNGKGPRWALLIRDVELSCPLSSHTTAEPSSRAPRIGSQPDKSDGRQFASNDHWTPPTLRATPQRHPRLNQADLYARVAV